MHLICWNCDTQVGYLHAKQHISFIQWVENIPLIFWRRPKPHLMIGCIMQVEVALEWPHVSKNSITLSMHFSSHVLQRGHVYYIHFQAVDPPYPFPLHSCSTEVD